MKSTIKSTSLSEGKQSHKEMHLAWQPQPLTKKKAKIMERSSCSGRGKSVCEPGSPYDRDWLKVHSQSHTVIHLRIVNLQ